jgi:carbonic anhydrase
MIAICATVVVASTSTRSAAGGQSARFEGGGATMSPEQAFDSLKIGNERFWRGRMLVRRYPESIFQGDTTHPFAAILGCIDARTPTDLMFDRGLGETFGVRIAGNFVNGDILGSLEYAVAVKHVSLIAVIGHTDCGAVKGAISNVRMGNLTGLLVKLTPAITAVPSSVQPRDTSNKAFVQRVADSNVTWTINQIRTLSPIIDAAIESRRVKLVGGMYNVKDGKVVFFKQ